MKLDIVIPTMWRSDSFLQALASYIANDTINKIIVVDNDKRNRPNNTLLHHSKIELVSYNKNIYVNPSWNEGYYRSTTTVLGILNDDIVVDTELFDYISKLDFKEIDLIGVHLQGTVDNYNITDHKDKTDKLIKLSVNKAEAIGGQSYAFGVCMFVKKTSYSVIPSLYQIWFGDDYLVQKCENIYSLKTSKIKGEISKTLVALTNNKDISDRIVLDCINAAKHGHIKNSKNWDLVRQTVDRSKMRFQTPVLDTFEQEYHKAVKQPSDINENLYVLYELAQTCKHVTEMGVRTGVSTRAFLNTDVQLVSYDINLNPMVSKLFETAKRAGKRVQYIKADVLEVEIAQTDLLFIDTLHTYNQLKKELELHADKSNKYIAFHDTYTYGLTGEDGTDRKGLLSAVLEFLTTNTHWRIKIYKTNNNGMLVLERAQT